MQLTRLGHSDLQVTKAPPRSADELGMPTLLVVAALVLWADVTSATRCEWSVSEPQRPPDALKCIRTVVLLV